MEQPLPEELDILYRPKRFKVLYGGRGGLKSWGFAQALELLGAEKELRILCTRELQGSIKESVHRLLSDTVSRVGLDSFYDIEVQSIKGKNNTGFFFEGLKNNVTKIKSFEGVDICWAEEAEAITEDSWDILIPTIRKPGSEIWISFNPDDEMGATYQRFVAPYVDEINKNGYYEDEDIYVAKIGWEEADKYGWFPEELRKEKDKCFKENPRKYAHIWMGEPNTDYEDSIIQPEWVDAAVNANEKIGFKARGIRAIGFDPADEGNDAKAYAIRHGVHVTDVEQWTTGDLEESVQRVYDIAFDKRCTNLVYDSIGIGAGAKIKFRQLNGNGDLSIEGFCGSESPDKAAQKYKGDRTNEDLFANKRAQYWWYLRDRFENTYRAIELGVYTNPDEMISLDGDMKHIKLLKAELTRVQRKRSRMGKSYIQIESKQDMKARALKSPNLADALVYAFANKAVAKSMGKPLDYSKMNRAMQR